MPEKDTQFQGKIKQAGIFDFKDFYAFAYDWLNEEGYLVTEKTYSEKVAGDSKDIDVEWEANKKVSDYFKYQIKMSWKILGMKSVEIQRDNKKVKTNSGVIEIKFKAILIKDYEARWEDKPIWKFLRGVYDRYIIRSRIEQYEDKLVSEVDDLVTQCKAYLAIEGKK
tara:strand:- start:134 stop:634 length:501 start_codon:yes stop_codon:yes gene_type:complete